MSVKRLSLLKKELKIQNFKIKKLSKEEVVLCMAGKSSRMSVPKKVIKHL